MKSIKDNIHVIILGGILALMGMMMYSLGEKVKQIQSLQPVRSSQLDRIESKIDNVNQTLSNYTLNQ